MERDIFDSVKEKEFSALTPDERAELAEICPTEFEFNQLKSVLSQVETMKSPQPKKETKEKLDNLFVQTYPKVAPIWYNGLFAIIVPREKPLYRQPLVQIAAVALIAFFTVPYFNQSMSPDTVQMAEVKKEVKVKSPESTESLNDVKNETSTRESTQEGISEKEGRAESVEEPIFIASAVVTSQGEKTSVFSSKADATVHGSDHPDGVFMWDEVSFSQPASESPGIFDLLTTSF